MILLPNCLYRGDSDPQNVRKLKATFRSGLLLTNLSDGGIGRDIFSFNLENLIRNHIAIGWSKTHFLSFSTSEEIAFHYGSNAKESFEVFDDKQDWDFSVITFDSSILIENCTRQIEKGIYKAEFIPNCIEFLPSFKIIIIDVLAYLSNISSDCKTDFSLAIANAKRDGEWLILPVSPFSSNGEFTAKLDTACISSKRIFRCY